MFRESHGFKVNVPHPDNLTFNSKLLDIEYNSLGMFNLSFTNINDQEVKIRRLFEALKTNSSVHTVDLSWTSIDDDKTVNALCDMLVRNEGIENLDLRFSLRTRHKIQVAQSLCKGHSHCLKNVRIWSWVGGSLDTWFLSQEERDARTPLLVFFPFP